MRFEDDPEAAEWLDNLRVPGDVEWDEGNQQKIRKHDVTPRDVEVLLGGPLLLAGRILVPEHSEPRWLALGTNEAGRRLALIFTRRGQRLRPISCRVMRRKERAFHDEQIGPEEPGG